MTQSHNLDNLSILLNNVKTQLPYMLLNTVNNHVYTTNKYIHPDALNVMDRYNQILEAHSKLPDISPIDNKLRNLVDINVYNSVITDLTKNIIPGDYIVFTNVTKSILYNVEYLINEINNLNPNIQEELVPRMLEFINNLHIFTTTINSETILPFVAYMLDYDTMVYKYLKLQTKFNNEYGLDITSILQLTKIILTRFKDEEMDELLCFSEMNILNQVKDNCSTSDIASQLADKLIYGDRLRFIELVNTLAELQRLGNTATPMHIRNDIINRYAEYKVELS